MIYKRFLRHLILVYLINQITLEAYVSGKPVLDEEEKFVFREQWQYVADSVCSDLEVSTSVVMQDCLESFLKSPFPSNPKGSSLVKIRCNLQTIARFQIEPSLNWQLVLLVPELVNGTDINSYSINYALVEPLKEYEEISTAPVNSTLWSSELLEGIPVQWRGGEIVSYDEVMTSERKYDVKVDFPRADSNDSAPVNALVKWNVSEDGDVCFDVVNICNKRDIQETKIWPDSKLEKLFTELSMDDSCTVHVIGLYGTTKFNYSTPSCEYYSDCEHGQHGEVDPEIPVNVTVSATEEEGEGDTWEVRVRWAAPRLQPEQYNVTLQARDNWTRVLPGNETEAVFKGVSGQGVYTVSMFAILGHRAAVTSRRAVFIPARGGRGAGAGGAARAAALALGAAAAACAAATLALACRRRRGGRPAPLIYLPEDKPSTKLDMESVSLTADAEDSWEVRSDKLLLHEVIGEGAFGVVRRATLAPTGTNVAVKMLKDFPSLEEIRSFRSEMELMKSVGVHPHLVSLVGCCSGRRPLIVAEYCSRGDLLTYLRCTWDIMVSKRNAKYYNNNIDISDYRNDLFKCKIQTDNSKLVVNKLYELQDICDRELTSLDLLSFCRQIAMGMEFLAANRVVHRDLAARNVLVTGDRTLKIADFGLSRDVYEENQYKQKGNGKMPVKWMALESLTRRIYTTQSDVWSFGVVVWEVATVGAAPYASVPAARLPRLLRAGYRMPRPANCSPQLYDIMLSCWRPSPRERPTFAELHARLDELLNSASAHHYLSLEIEPADAPPTPKHHRYIKMFMRGKRNWSRGESYERPLPPQSNHYTSPPAAAGIATTT